MALLSIVAEISARLDSAGIEDARSEVWLLVAAVTGRDRMALVAGARGPLSAGQRVRLEQLVRRRLAREPIAYILGEKEFWSLPFAVGPGVLIPRPETETVVEAALSEIADRHAPLRLLDFGTGSGCLLLALLSELPHATGLGIDASRTAIQIATRNATRLNLADRASFRLGDWSEPPDDPVDVIVSNPPYVAEADWPTLQPEIREFEPKGALLAGPDGLAAYRALAPLCVRLLTPHGFCAFEIGQGQSTAVRALLAARGLTVNAQRADLAGIERCLIARPAAA